ncbi:hypothetical protein KTE48_29410 [Burkholderia gladioli]|nr:hypothetical protein [Burkholderia gladioli]
MTGIPSTGGSPAAPEPGKSRRGADILVEVLRSEGVEYVFGNPGTTELSFVDALTGVDGLSYILGLQEAAVVAMADGYAQASGRPGFVNLHTRHVVSSAPAKSRRPSNTASPRACRTSSNSRSARPEWEPAGAHARVARRMAA